MLRCPAAATHLAGRNAFLPVAAMLTCTQTSTAGLVVIPHRMLPTHSLRPAEPAKATGGRGGGGQLTCRQGTRPQHSTRACSSASRSWAPLHSGPRPGPGPAPGPAPWAGLGRLRPSEGSGPGPAWDLSTCCGRGCCPLLSSAVTPRGAAGAGCATGPQCAAAQACSGGAAAAAPPPAHPGGSSAAPRPAGAMFPPVTAATALPLLLLVAAPAAAASPWLGWK